jgi:hypothetical protein
VLIVDRSMAGQADNWMMELLRARELLCDAGIDADGLYSRWFHLESGISTAWPSGAAYRAAILDSRRFERGWRAVRSHGLRAGGVVAMRGGRERVVAPPEMVPEDARFLMVERGVALRLDPLSSEVAAGFWHLWSLRWQQASAKPALRFYLNVRVGQSLDLAARVASLAPCRRPWALKVLSGTHDSGRRDRALLYLSSEADSKADWFVELLSAIAGYCEEGLPPFVERLRPGVGRAPDPADGRSFGQAICAALARAAQIAQDASSFEREALTAIGAIPGMDPRLLAPWTQR